MDKAELADAWRCDPELAARLPDQREMSFDTIPWRGEEDLRQASVVGRAALVPWEQSYLVANFCGRHDQKEVSHVI